MKLQLWLEKKVVKATERFMRNGTEENFCKLNRAELRLKEYMRLVSEHRQESFYTVPTDNGAFESMGWVNRGSD